MGFLPQQLQSLRKRSEDLTDVAIPQIETLMNSRLSQAHSANSPAIYDRMCVCVTHSEWRKAAEDLHGLHFAGPVTLAGKGNPLLVWTDLSASLHGLYWWW